MTIQRQFAIVLAAGVVLGCSSVTDSETADSDSPDAPNGDTAEIQQAITGNTSDFGETVIASPVTFSGTRVRALLVAGSRVYVGGRFSFTSGGQTYTNLAAFDLPTNPSGSLTLATGFHPTINSAGTVWAIATDGTKIYIGGEFTTVNSTARAKLAALSSSGTLDTTFKADVGGASCNASSDPECAASPPYSGDLGVHALALDGTTLIVGGNFNTIGTSTRQGLAAVDATTGAVSTSKFTTGVPNGFVQALYWVPSLSTAYIGGHFASIQGSARTSLAATNGSGTVKTGTFSVGSNPVIDLDFDPSGSGKLFVAVGGNSSGSNSVYAFNPAGGSYSWRSTKVQGDVEAVHFYNGAVYFGFHDGMFVNGSGGTNGDQYKIAGVNASNGKFLIDKAHSSGTCSSANPDYCWAPPADPAGVATGFWGIWAIEHYTSTSGTRLLVGGDVNKWNGTSSKLFASFGP